MLHQGDLDLIPRHVACSVGIAWIEAAVHLPDDCALLDHLVAHFPDLEDDHVAAVGITPVSYVGVGVIVGKEVGVVVGVGVLVGKGVGVGRTSAAWLVGGSEPETDAISKGSKYCL